MAAVGAAKAMKTLASNGDHPVAQAIHSDTTSENRKLAVLMRMALTYVDGAVGWCDEAHTRICHSAVGISCVPTGRVKMSVRSAVLVEEFSATWLRNALAGTVGALVLLVLLILFP